jgi:hypothetical protein
MRDQERVPAAPSGRAAQAPEKAPGLHDARESSKRAEALSALANGSARVMAQRRVRDAVVESSSSNRQGLPAQLRSGIEALSGFDMSGVKVHFNSARPAQLNAHAYAQGSDIHLAPGQEQHLPHEAWHVVQQAQGRVNSTRQLKGGVQINDNEGLEHEADVMGERAQQLAAGRDAGATVDARPSLRSIGANPVLQGRFVHFHSAPPAAAASDHTWVMRSSQIVGEVRPTWVPATLTAIDARQGSMAGVRGTAIRHINAWDTFLAELVGMSAAGQTLAQVGASIHNRWPTTSVLADPGIPGNLDNDTVSAYAEEWLDARHNDPANLFIGHSGQNSGLGNAYDNPTKAGGANRTAGTAFDAQEKQALVTQQVQALTGTGPGTTIGAIAWSGPFGMWMAQIDFPALQRQEYRRMDGSPVSFDKVVKMLSNNKVFVELELHKVFRTPANRTGAL